MKKLIICLVFFGFTFSLHAQGIFKTPIDEGGAASYSGSRTILCPPASIYSHTVDYNNGLSSMEPPHIAYWDQIETAPGAPISQIVFFGIANGTPSRNFTINFYHDNGGIPGTLMASYTDFMTGVNTGEILFEKVIYSYSYTFPSTLVFNAGDWVSVVAADGDMWYWLTGSGGDGCVYNNYVGEWCDLGDLAFCLIGGLGAPEVPVAPWALTLGMALIVITIILRYRRMI